MNNSPTHQIDNASLPSLKTWTASVYLCQVLAFALVGLPLLVGVAINFIKQDEVRGTWLESHFDWQIKTAWMALAGLALAGLTLNWGIGFFILIATIVLLVYRIVVGWHRLNSELPMDI